MNIKSKIYLTAAIWVGVCLAMFAYGFKRIDAGNRGALAKISSEQSELAVLRTEEENYRQARKDLQDLAAKPLQPEAFFSTDISLVKEIEELEALGKTLSVDLTLGGISGTINSVPKAKTQGQLFLVPYQITVMGSFENVVAFVETLENLDFITSLSSLSLSSAGSGNVVAGMSATFYIRK